jgi:NADP-dependent 3-hydroxy acid dehydrogenase YdfG
MGFRPEHSRQWGIDLTQVRKAGCVGKKVVVITGASSGFGALTARALANAGHTACVGMREASGRNAPQVQAIKAAIPLSESASDRWMQRVVPATSRQTHNSSAKPPPRR